MFSIRNNAARVARSAMRPSTTASAFKATSISARFLNESAAPKSKREVIAEKQIPVAEYVNNSPKHTSIPVRDDPDVEVPIPEEPKTVKPITREMYEKLPKALQKLTVMDKVIIITG